MSKTLTRKEKQERTRSSLLSSAAKLICRKGITEASVEDIATDAGYTKGAFYANFKSKEEMFLVMLDKAYAEELERLEAHLSGEAHVEEVRRSAEDFLQFVRADPEWPRLYFEFVAYAARNPEFRDELATRNRAMRDQIAEVIRRWTADFDGDPPFPYEDIATMLFCLADGFLVQQLVEPNTDPALYATMNTTLFKGIVASAIDLDVEALAQAQEAKSRKAGAGR
jgi:AcrR family transcriptional regulator